MHLLSFYRNVKNIDLNFRKIIYNCNKKKKCKKWGRDMFEYIDNKEYRELCVFLQKLAVQLKEQDLQSTLYEEIAKLKEAFSEFSALKSALDQSIIVAVTDRAGKILYANDEFCRSSKYSREELVGKTHRVINSGYHDKNFFKNLWDTILRGEIWEGNIKNRSKDGEYYWVKTSIVPFCDENKKPYMFIALRTNVTKWKLQEEQLFNTLKNDYNLVVNSMHSFIYKLERNDSGTFTYLFGEGKLAYQLNLNTSVIAGKSPEQLFPKELARWLKKNTKKLFPGKLFL